MKSGKGGKEDRMIEEEKNRRKEENVRKINTRTFEVNEGKNR